MKANILILSTIILGIPVFTSCQNAPTEEINSAKMAIENVQKIGAEVYDSDNFLLLEDSLKSAIATVDAEGSKLFKDYQAAIEKLQGVTAFASSITSNIEVKKKELKTQTVTAISDTKTLIAENIQLIDEAPKGKEGNSALLAMRGELSALDTLLNETSDLLVKEALQPALEKATVARDKATALNTELKDIMSKYKTAKK
jgi:hypothetical protein